MGISNPAVRHVPHLVSEIGNVSVKSLDGGRYVSRWSQLFFEKENTGMLVELKEVIIVSQENAIALAEKSNNCRIFEAEFEFVLYPNDVVAFLHHQVGHGAFDVLVATQLHTVSINESGAG